MKVLVVEDYDPLRKAVVRSLRENGFSVDEASDGEEGYVRAASEDYDVVVLDLMLPKVDGLEVLSRLRESGGDGHVLILTARDAIEDRVRGLDLGADDYLVKPFAMDEFLARVRALVRRDYKLKSPWIEIGPLSINTSDHTVTLDGATIELTAREYALLEYLAFRRGQVVTRTDIWEHLYDEHASLSSNVVDVYIGYLRKKIERKGQPRLLKTRRGEGYILSDEDA